MKPLAELLATVRQSYQPRTSVLKAAASPVAVYSLAGRLYLSQSGWLMLHVPNKLVDAVFSALAEPGVQRPAQSDGSLRAHISVMTADEVEQIGAGNITERGKVFRYQLGPVKTVVPETWPGVSKVWYVTVESPELKQLRKTYGLSPLVKEDHDFHITVAIRKTHVLKHNDQTKLPE